MLTLYQRTSVFSTIQTMQVVFCLTLAVAALVLVNSTPIADKESGITKECKSFCSTCGCMGFYCGEECICECNDKLKPSDSKCVSEIHENAIRLKPPYEILIQGPSDSAIVQTAKEYSEGKQCCKRHINDKQKSKRNSFVIYRPMGLEQFLKTTAFSHNIGKRSILDKENKKSWYEGETVPFLVRPAPRGKPVKDVFHQKRSPSTDNDFWYKDDQKTEDSSEKTNELGLTLSLPISTQSNILPKVRNKISSIKDIFGLRKFSDNIDFFSDYDKDNTWLSVFGKPSSGNSLFSNSGKSSVFGDKIPKLLGSAKKLFTNDEDYEDSYIS